MTSRLVLMFPGQSSRYPAMLQKIVDADAASARLLRRASEILGRDLERHYRADNPSIFASNRDVQVGVFLANHLHLMLLQEAGIHSRWSVGLSLGEYNHLVHIGALSFDTALQLVDSRGRIYNEGEGGKMVSVFPVEASLVEQVIGNLGLTGRVCVGLYNSPKQQVISGECCAVEEVLAALDAETFFEATVIEPRLPMHARVFESFGARLGEVLQSTPMTAPALPYVPNVLGRVFERASVRRIRSCLAMHVYRPVHWRRSVEALADRIEAPCFIEVGPRTVLSNLFGRGWNPGRHFATDAVDGWRDHQQALSAELRYAS